MPIPTVIRPVSAAPITAALTTAPDRPSRVVVVKPKRITRGVTVINAAAVVDDAELLSCTDLRFENIPTSELAVRVLEQGAVRSLELFDCELDWSVFGLALQRSKLQSLRLSTCQFFPASMVNWDERKAQREVHQQIQRKFIDCVAKAQHLRTLSLYAEELDSTYLCSMLKANPTLTSLEIRDDNLYRPSAFTVSSGLLCNSHLTNLQLRQSRCGSRVNIGSCLRYLNRNRMLRVIWHSVDQLARSLGAPDATEAIYTHLIPPVFDPRYLEAARAEGVTYFDKFGPMPAELAKGFLTISSVLYLEYCNG